MRFTKALLLVLLVFGLGACAGNDVVYQTSTIHALLAGVYDGETTWGDLKGRGDIGIGTFNALDGEMVVLEGRCYQVAADGRAREMSASTRTPFAVVTPFEEDRTLRLSAKEGFEAFTEALSERLENPNQPCAVRIDGVFSYMKTRSVPRQEKPYRRLAEVVKEQPTFEFSDTRGTIVGFYLPAYLEGINVPGYHFHFLTEDRAAGGHILDFRAEVLRVALDSSAELHLALPGGEAFRRAALEERNSEELEAVEKDR